MASSRSGLFCGAFDCNNNKSVQKARDFFRYPKEKIYFQCWLFIRKNKINDLVCTRPILNELNKINNPRSKFYPIPPINGSCQTMNVYAFYILTIVDGL